MIFIYRMIPILILFLQISTIQSFLNRAPHIGIMGRTATGKTTLVRNFVEHNNYAALYEGQRVRSLAFISETENYQYPPIEYLWNGNLKFDNKGHSFLKKSTGHYEDITELLKNPDIAQYASTMYRNTQTKHRIRNYLQEVIIQSELPVIIDCRDPRDILAKCNHAKTMLFYLAATVEERAKRWHRSQKKNKQFTFDEAEKLVGYRDKLDIDSEYWEGIFESSNNTNNIIFIDTTNMSPEEVLGKVLEHILINTNNPSL